jgi:hypothetical protein
LVTVRTLLIVIRVVEAVWCGMDMCFLGAVFIAFIGTGRTEVVLLLFVLVKCFMGTVRITLIRAVRIHIGLVVYRIVAQ